MEVNYGHGKTPTARTGRQETDGATTGSSPGTLGAFSYKGAMGLNPDEHAEASGICVRSRQPFGVDGHLDPRQVIDIGVMNGDFPAPLLAFDDDDEVFVNSHWMGTLQQWLAGQPRRPRRCGKRQFPRGASSGGIRLAELDCIRLLI